MTKSQTPSTKKKVCRRCVQARWMMLYFVAVFLISGAALKHFYGF